MLTDQDIDRITAAVVGHGDVRSIKDDVSSLTERMENVEDILGRVLTGLDRVATAVENNNLANAVTDTKIARHDRWIHELADHTQVKLIA